MCSKRIRTVIVEDDGQLRPSIAAELQADVRLNVIATFSSGEKFLAELNDLDAEVVIIEIDLPGTNGIECVRIAKPKKPGIEFLIITVFENPTYILPAIHAGATGYLVKSASNMALADAVVDIHHGGSPMSPAIARSVVTSMHGATSPAIQQEQLTTREKDVLDGLATGLMYKEIADRHGVNINTVRTHVRSIYDKLQVHSRHDALKRAFPGRG